MRSTSARLTWGMGILLAASIIGCTSGQMLTDPVGVGTGQARVGSPVRS
jgi:hypothetical protein